MILNNKHSNIMLIMIIKFWGKILSFLELTLLSLDSSCNDYINISHFIVFSRSVIIFLKFWPSSALEDRTMDSLQKCRHSEVSAFETEPP